ncbi:MAG TPA: type II toxin-antitoxin system VapC family toxin, partial [Candidatus Xenobia bacterium]
KDDLAQAGRAREVIRDAVDRGERCFVGLVVLCELVWVLRQSYGVSRADMVKALEGLLNAEEFEIERRDVALNAFHDFKTAAIDFADAVIGYCHHGRGCAQTVTFDKRLRRSALFKVL